MSSYALAIDLDRYANTIKTNLSEDDSPDNARLKELATKLGLVAILLTQNSKEIQQHLTIISQECGELKKTLLSLSRLPQQNVTWGDVMTDIAQLINDYQTKQNASSIETQRRVIAQINERARLFAFSNGMFPPKGTPKEIDNLKKEDDSKPPECN